jgi:histidinol-phosphate aminotransferase
MAPSAANFLFVHVRRTNAPVAEGLLRHGVIVKPWKEAGYEEFIRVSIGSAQDNQLFLQAFDAVMRSDAPGDAFSDAGRGSFAPKSVCS